MVKSREKLNASAHPGALCIAATLLISLTACERQVEETAEASASVETLEEAAAAEARAAVNEASISPSSESSVNSECQGFVDGSSRRNTLAGIALGDSIYKVKKQLRCGSVVFELKEANNGNFGQEYDKLHGGRSINSIRGNSGSEGISILFIGTPGKEKVVEVSRGASYKNDIGPSVNDFVKKIYSKFPDAQELQPDYVRRTIGFSNSASGQKTKNQSQITGCAWQSMMTNDCGFTFVTYFYPGENAGLIGRYGANLTNGAAAKAALDRAITELRTMEGQRHASEIEQANDVRGF